MARYELLCVAPEIPGRGSTDDLDEAILASDAHYEVYDTVTRKFVPVGPEDYEEARANVAARRSVGVTC